MREIRQSGSEGGGTQTNAFSLPLSLNFSFEIGSIKKCSTGFLPVSSSLDLDVVRLGQGDWNTLVVVFINPMTLAEVVSDAGGCRRKDGHTLSGTSLSADSVRCRKHPDPKGWGNSRSARSWSDWPRPLRVLANQPGSTPPLPLLPPASPYL